MGLFYCVRVAYCVRRDPFLFFANAPGLMMGLFFTISSLPLADPATRLRIELLLYILLVRGPLSLLAPGSKLKVSV